MDQLKRIVKRSVVSTHPKATVQEAAEVMMAAKVGALVVIDESKLVGILSERDVVGRVVVPRRDATKTLVSDVMTREVKTARIETTLDAAMETMDTGHFRHLPVVDEAGHVVGVLSMRDLLRRRAEELAATSQRLVDYFSADGPGG